MSVYLTGPAAAKSPLAPTFATPLGYADGADGNALAITTEPASSAGITLVVFESGGSLSLSTASVVIPAFKSGATYNYAVYYQ